MTDAGIPDKQARSLIGKWRAAHGDGAVMEAIVDCRARAITNPVEWIVARFAKPRDRPSAPGSFLESLLQRERNEELKRQRAEGVA